MNFLDALKHIKENLSLLGLPPERLPGTKFVFDTKKRVVTSSKLENVIVSVDLPASLIHLLNEKGLAETKTFLKEQRSLDAKDFQKQVKTLENVYQLFKDTLARNTLSAPPVVLFFSVPDFDYFPVTVNTIHTIN